jgi:pimeloyl-ACP methyl ester carboxylesterase
VGPNPVDEHTFTTDRGPVHYRSAPAADVPPLYLHGIPTSSADWVPFLERSGGFAPDLIGFGRSSKAGHLDYSLAGLATFVAELLDHLQLDRFSVVAHQWGAAVAVQLAVRHPERVERLALINPLPLIEGFRWPGVARWLRRPLVGELMMGATTKRMLARALRRGSASQDAWSQGRIGRVWEDFDQGTQRAILRLHRGTAEGTLDRVLGELRPPATILWGDRDPWLAASLGDAYAERIPSAGIEHLDAGHWPWLDRPELVERVAALAGP